MEKPSINKLHGQSISLERRTQLRTFSPFGDPRPRKGGKDSWTTFQSGCNLSRMQAVVAQHGRSFLGLNIEAPKSALLNRNETSYVS